MFAKALIGLLLISNVYANYSNAQLVMSIARSCIPSRMICPKPEFGKFVGHLWEWNVQAIEESPEAAEFRRARIWNMDTLAEMRATYCCLSGPCLLRCGILQRVEIDLIRKFPDNAMEIFSLNIPQINQHREFIENYIAQAPHEGSPPAELEEFFDDIHKYQDLIRQKLAEVALLKQLRATI